VTQYQRALAIQPNRPLANFRMGEAFFYRKNYQRQPTPSASTAKPSPNRLEKWSEVWSHIYLGKIFDMLGQREARPSTNTAKQNKPTTTRGGPASRGRIPEKGYSEAEPPSPRPPAARPRSPR